MADPLPIAPPPQQPPKTDQKAQWGGLLKLLPLIAIASKQGGRDGVAAFLQGYQRAKAAKEQQGQQQQQFAGQQQLQQAQIQNLNADNARADAQLQNTTQENRLKTMQTIQGGFGNLDTPEQIDQYIQAMSPFAQQQGIELGALQAVAPKPTALQKKAAEKRIAALKSQFGEAKWMEQGAQFTHDLSNGEKGVPFQKVLEYAGYTQDPNAPPVGTDVDLTKSGLDVQAAAALKRGDTAEYNRLLKVKKEMGQADNTPRAEPRQRYNVQPITNPDGTTGLVRINMDTGETTRVELPQGANSGRATDTERVSKGYLGRAELAEQNAKAFESQLAGLGRQLDVQLPNLLKSGAGQQYQQARDEFINASLRRESGAVISPAEYARFENIYFVRPGDTAATIAQKQQARKRVIDGLRVAAGPMGTEAPPTQNPFRR